MTKKLKIASHSLNINCKRFKLCRLEIKLSAHARTPGIYDGAVQWRHLLSGGGIGVGYPVFIEINDFTTFYALVK